MKFIIWSLKSAANILFDEKGGWVEDDFYLQDVDLGFNDWIIRVFNRLITDSL